MAAENRPTGKQAPVQEERLTLEGRQLLRVTGIREVLRFDETEVILQTAENLLAVRGSGLALRQLTREGGLAEIRGQIDAVSYGQRVEQGGLLRRLFG